MRFSTIGKVLACFLDTKVCHFSNIIFAYLLKLLMPHQVMLKGIDCSLGTIADLKFGKNVGHVRLDRLERDKKFICDTLIFVALGDELENISLTRQSSPHVSSM